MAIVLMMVTGMAYGQRPMSDEAKLAPRSSVFNGTADMESARGIYVITFPAPNECLTPARVKAPSRGMALYRWVSAGGFALKPSNAGLTIWTIEEWESTMKEMPGFAAQHAKYCEAQK